MSTYNGTSLKNMTYNGQKVSSWIHNGVEVYSAGSVVTYYVDTSSYYTEEVDSGATCLSPTTFTPTKSGWYFVGWRENNTASSSVLTSKVMGDSPVALFAVFAQDITLTYYDDSTTAKTVKGAKYYNNGNTTNPTFKLSQATKSGWTARGWSTSNAGNAGVTYDNNASFTLSTNTTLYGLYQRTVTLTYYNNSTTASTTTGTRYYNSAGNNVNPTFNLTQATKSGWTARGWSTGTSGNSGIVYNNAKDFTLSENTTLYGMYYQTITATFISNGTQTANGTRYWNSNGNVTNASVTAPTGGVNSGWSWRGWAAAGVTTANASVSYANGATISGLTANTTFYGLWQATVTVTYYNNSTTASTTTGTRYYNCAGKTIDPTFTLTQTVNSGWTARGWSTTNAGNATITYNNATAFTRSSDITLYGLCQQTITLSYNGNGSTSGSVASQTGTRYWAPAGFINPSFKLNANGFAKTDYNFSKWAMGSTNGTQYAAGASVTLTASTTFYAVWTVKSSLTVYTATRNTVEGVWGVDTYTQTYRDSSHISAITNPTVAYAGGDNCYVETESTFTINYGAFKKAVITYQGESMNHYSDERIGHVKIYSNGTEVAYDDGLYLAQTVTVTGTTIKLKAVADTNEADAPCNTAIGITSIVLYP